MMRKKAICLLIAMVIFILSGCGGDKTAATVETAASVQGETSETEATSAAEEISGAVSEASEAAGGVPAVSGNMISVGVVGSNPEESAYHLAVDTELKNLFTEENGYAASFVYKERSEEQVTAAKQFIADGVDYLLLSADDAADWKSVLTDAQKAGIRVILFDRIIDVDESLYEAAVVSDPDREGKNAVNWLKSQDLSECSIIHLQGTMGTEEQKALTGALDAQVSADSAWKIVERQTADGNAEKAKRIVQAVIDSGESFNVIYAESDDMAKGAVAALDAADISHGVNGSVVVISFGANRWALEELLAQNWNYDGQRSFLQAFYIDEAIMTMESGGTLAEKVIVMDEKGFEATTITAEDIMIYGIS